MVDRPIIFSAPMVRALIEGRKTQTRRVLALRDGGHVARTGNFCIGDRLWVRESFRGAKGYDDFAPKDFGNKPNWYVADGEPDMKVWWHLSDKVRPAFYMPRFISRITLDVTKVRVQRLQEISHQDCIDEGIEKVFYDGESEVYAGQFGWKDYQFDHPHSVVPFRHNMPILSYKSLWNALNEDRGYSWMANPWVVALTFTVDKRNIDAEVAA